MIMITYNHNLEDYNTRQKYVFDAPLSGGQGAGLTKA